MSHVFPSDLCLVLLRNQNDLRRPKARTDLYHNSLLSSIPHLTNFHLTKEIRQRYVTSRNTSFLIGHVIKQLYITFLEVETSKYWTLVYEKASALCQMTCYQKLFRKNIKKREVIIHNSITSVRETTRHFFMKTLRLNTKTRLAKWSQFISPTSIQS